MIYFKKCAILKSDLNPKLKNICLYFSNVYVCIPEQTTSTNLLWKVNFTLQLIRNLTY